MSLRFFSLSLLACFAAALTAFAQTTPARPPSTPAATTNLANLGDNELVGPIKMPDADLDTVLGALELYTGRSILRPSTLQVSPGGYNIVLPRPMAKSDVILAIETVLQLNNIAVLPLGDKFLRVVPLSVARTETPEIINGSTLDRPASGKIASKLFMLEFLRVNEFVAQIQSSMLSPNIGVGFVLLQNSNAALITDTISNLQRIEMLLKQIDRPVTTTIKPKFYTLQNGAKASDVVAKIRSFISPTLQLQLGDSTTYSADDRTNQVILIADPRQHEFFDALISKLDVKADPNTRNEVIYLQHAVAAPVAQLLSQIVSSQNAASQKNNQSVRRGQGVQPTTPAGAPPPGGAPTVATAAAGFDLPGANEFSGLMTIGSDERSNAIVVSGTIDDIRLIKELINKLDILLAQVRIEVIIAEVTLNDTDKSGISALGLTFGTDDVRGTHITNFSGTVAGWAVTEGVVNPLAFKAALADAGSRSRLNVLQNPTIVTTHGKQGQVVVGQSTPVVSSIQSTPAATATANSGFATQSTVNYKEVNLDLKVTPFIGNDGSIQLTIDQTIDDIIGNVSIPGVGDQPIVGHRKATSFINVYDGQMIVLGGLQRNSFTNNRAKLGLIYEIPILSNLFGDRTKKSERTELLLFIRPHVIAPNEGSADANKTINTLSNRDQIQQYLKDPSKMPREGLIENLK